jgi:hypothetical protein
VTWAPDNLVWLRGRARAEGRGSLSEFLDRIVTRARSGHATPRPVRSMKGALGWLADGPLDVDAVHAISPAEWQAWHDRWDVLLADVNLEDGPGRPASRGPGGRAPLTVAERPSPRFGRVRRA